MLLILTFLVAAAAAKSLQSCPTLCDPIDGSPPGSSVPGILPARTKQEKQIIKTNIKADRRRKWQPTPVFLPGESEMGEPGGLPSMGSHRVGHD